MTAKSKALKSRSPKPVQSSDTEERIRSRAYELYEQRGRVDELRIGRLAPSRGRDTRNANATEGQSSEGIEVAARPRCHRLTVKETTLEFLPPHEVVDITPIPPETKVVPPLGGLNTETGTVPGCAMSEAGMSANS